mgnify:CR=1 FL=1|jgi:hypothetical protein
MGGENSNIYPKAGSIIKFVNIFLGVIINFSPFAGLILVVNRSRLNCRSIVLEQLF